MCINEGGLRRTVYLRIFWRERRPSAGIFVYEMDTLVYIHIDVYIYFVMSFVAVHGLNRDERGCEDVSFVCFSLVFTRVRWMSTVLGLGK